MSTSFTSALPQRLPSNITPEPHFRRRSHNITLKQLAEDVPHSPSIYPPSTPHQLEVSPFDDLIDKLRDPPYCSRLRDVSQITPDSANLAVASPQPVKSSSARQGRVFPRASSPVSPLWSSLLPQSRSSLC